MGTTDFKHKPLINHIHISLACCHADCVYDLWLRNKLTDLSLSLFASWLCLWPLVTKQTNWSLSLLVKSVSHNEKGIGIVGMALATFHFIYKVCSFLLSISAFQLANLKPERKDKLRTTFPFQSYEVCRMALLETSQRAAYRREMIGC